MTRDGGAVVSRVRENGAFAEAPARFAGPVAGSRRPAGVSILDG